MERSLFDLLGDGGGGGDETNIVSFSLCMIFKRKRDRVTKQRIRSE